MFQEPQQGNENELMHAKEDQQEEKVNEWKNEWIGFLWEKAKTKKKMKKPRKKVSVWNRRDFSINVKSSKKKFFF
jgi:hypothetical protein